MADNTRSDQISKAFKLGSRLAITQAVYTSTPGVVNSYDVESKRAVIQPAIMRSFTDGRSSIPMAPLVDVPVIQPATGGYLIHQQINPGDIVLVHFTKEGLDQFKARWDANVEPTPGKLFSDAFASLVGVHDIQPISNEGIVLQSADGRTYIHLKENRIELRSGSKRLRITPERGDFN